ncbi:sugar ABC transporter substrate-binding protein [Trinickia caryophylli]|uniref:Monosaccharide ABC transporter substrate-binding protein, CUT2 family n=1 Tax=Trinickia caryophylli TaxID=28094 RepID=A0A1X7EC97_TRICW|nr:sugar ABC transporter substrate-binding protein [Trinickia caryophylli]PMS12911.1 rhizopine-binding protein [Trinickia caryophylli]TRX14668.1 sugar ABC transporter substrate-binding protein [Trinickia caryophylli]WQE14512.1 sugar ABC transporter substrate-binding protein [Trinickia caryophylli]SMF31509.1 monosaccharide ABC transporter substrate-binding protein, CUT2 family [Trinickia caryophylli]GLU32082.1 rhizopine-binding protein [Trinickia caryophylli]
MKLIRVLVAAAVVVAAAAGCGQAFAQAAEVSKPKLGVAMAEFDDTFPTLVREAISKEARNRGWKPVFADGHSDQKRQDQEVQDLIARDHVAALVILPVDATATSVMTNAARAAGVPVVYVNRKPAESLGKGFGYVGSEDIVAGRLQGEYVAQQLGGKGDIAIMIGVPSTAAAAQRTQGVKEVLSRHPGMHIVAEEVGDWRRDKGLEITKNWLTQGRKIDAIVSNNDEMAIGAIIALRKAGRAPDSIFIMGVDATPDGLAQMDKGALKATVYQDAVGQGKTSVDLVMRMKAGDASAPATMTIPFRLITPQNYKELLAY